MLKHREMNVDHVEDRVFACKVSLGSHSFHEVWSGRLIALTLHEQMLLC
jgi:hypothetical protein